MKGKNATQHKPSSAKIDTGSLAHQSKAELENCFHKRMTKDMRERALFMLTANNAVIGVSSEDWATEYHNPSSGRNTPSDLRREYGVRIGKKKFTNLKGKVFWRQFIEDRAEANKLADVITQSTPESERIDLIDYVERFPVTRG